MSWPIRLNRPSICRGTILPGCHKNKDVDIVSVFEAVGAHANKSIDDNELTTIESCAIPGPGSCGGMYTANTMACAIEALGLSLPNSSAQAAESDEKHMDCQNAGEAVLHLIDKNITPKDILTKQSFENAITVITALGVNQRGPASIAMAKQQALILAWRFYSNCAQTQLLT